MSDKVVVSFAPGASWQVGPVGYVRTVRSVEDMLEQLANFRELWQQAAEESGEDIHAIKIDLALVLDDLERIVTGSAQF